MHYRAIKGDSNNMTGRHWSVQLIRTIWNHIQAQWKNRNVWVHGQDDNPTEQPVNSQIKALYGTSSRLTVTYR